jgi:uncharacterized repeat protein (TIGR03803 family)
MPTPTSLHSPKRPRIPMAILMLAVALGLAASAHGQTETTLYDFGTVPPYAPTSGPVIDKAGNLYGAANNVVYELAHTSSGWQANVIFTFPGGDGGSNPGATPVFGSDGSLYGTAENGGAYNYGLVYKLSPTASGTWEETVLYSFTGGADGSYPTYGTVVFDKAGNLYSSNIADGSINAADCQNSVPTGCGVIFALSPTKSGEWRFHLLHSFSGGWDGIGPAFLNFDPAGTLYGTAPGAWGGWESPNSPGLVFKLTPTASGPWKDTVVYSFKGDTDGGLPGNLVFDNMGNMYGSGADGGNINNCWSGYGPIGCGVVFKISPAPDGKWKETPIYAFSGGSDGSQPDAGIVFSHGKLYGPTFSGGSDNQGVLFELSPNSKGSWTESVAHSFLGTDGSIPSGTPWVDPSGNIYGVTRYGGSTGWGVVWEFIP